MNWKALVAAAVMLVAGSARAQILQSGNVTAGHAGYWVYNGILGDAGPATSGVLTGLGVTANSSTGICQNTHATTQAYVEFCLGVTDSLATISVQGFSEATPPLQVCLGGVCTSFNGGGAVLNTRIISSGSSDSASSSDGLVFWNSSTTSSKTETLYTCNSITAGYTIFIIDQIGTAGTYPIVVSPAVGNTILNTTAYAITSPFGSVRFGCNGVSNWSVLGG